VMMSRDPQGGLRDPMMRVTLLVSAAAFVLTFAWLLLVRIRSLRVSDELADLERRTQAP
jgi:hypothetical protein